MASNWADLMSYEKEIHENRNVQEQEKKSKCEKLKQIKENTGKRFSLVCDQISVLCR